MIDPRILVGAASLILAFSSGWLVHGWKYDADSLADEQERQNAYIKATQKANEASAALDAAVRKLEENRFVTMKETHHETTKTEYRCILPDAGRVLFNRSAEPSPDSR